MILAAVVTPYPNFLFGWFEDTPECFQRLVNGDFECHYTIRDCTMWVNEDGRNLPQNSIAAQLSGLPIVGNAVFTGPPDAEGKTTNVSEKVVDQILTLISKER